MRGRKKTEADAEKVNETDKIKASEIEQPNVDAPPTKRDRRRERQGQ